MNYGNKGKDVAKMQASLLRFRRNPLIRRVMNQASWVKWWQNYAKHAP